MERGMNAINAGVTLGSVWVVVDSASDCAVERGPQRFGVHQIATVPP